MAYVSFEGIGEVCASFFADDGLKRGTVVKLTSDDSVEECGLGDRFMGITMTDARGGMVTVQVGGFAQLPCDDENVTAGYASLVSDGQGGVKAAGTGQTGTEYLVVTAYGDGYVTVLL